MTCAEHDEVQATITGFGPQSKFAFTETEQYGTVTFALSNDVWSGDSIPQEKQVVMLSVLKKMDKGWRAMKARPFSLKDEGKDSAKR